MTAPTAPPEGRAGREAAPWSRLLLVPAIAAGLGAAALSPVPVMHQAAGAALVVVLGGAAYGLLTRLVPGLDPVPAAGLAAVGSVALLILVVTALAAASVPISRAPMVAAVATLAAGLQVAAGARGPSRSHSRLDRYLSARSLSARSGPGRRRPMAANAAGHRALVAVVATAVTGVLAIDAGAVTARLAPHPPAAPFTSLSFTGPAARWSQPLDVRAGQVVEVPLEVLNRTGRPQVYRVDYRLGAAGHPVAVVRLAAGGRWHAAVAVAMPRHLCPTRLAFDAASAGSSETVDVWLRWAAGACG